MILNLVIILAIVYGRGVIREKGPEVQAVEMPLLREHSGQWRQAVLQLR